VAATGERPLTGRTALITGAARGQGRAHALRLAEEGARLALLDIRSRASDVDDTAGRELEETATLVRALGAEVLTFAGDVRDSAYLDAAVAETVDRFGSLDIVVVNAAVAGSRDYRLFEIPDAEWDLVTGVNLRGAWQTVKASSGPLMASGRGSVVLIGSTCAGKGYPYTGHYTVAKHGLIGLMRVLANELGSSGVRVNMVNPTFVDTELLHQPDVYRAFVDDGVEPSRENFAAATQALHLLPTPWVSPGDVTEAVVWLASDAARFVTGQQLNVDAGALTRA
jgi:(+)-trans-carveol dehydrogenase